MQAPTIWIAAMKGSQDESELGAGLGIGGNAARVVVGRSGNQARA